MNLMLRRLAGLGLMALLALSVGCAHLGPSDGPDRAATLYWPEMNETPISRHAPAFLARGTEAPANRIGRPVARGTRLGVEIDIDPEAPTIYTEVQDVSTPKARYTNLIYRIHFPEVPFRLIPFRLTAGDNVGILVIVTVDGDDRPVLVTTAGTCGCYAAVVPTDALDPAAWPDGWDPAGFELYGEELPGILRTKGMAAPRIVVRLRPEVHRVMDLTVVDAADGMNFSDVPRRRADLVPMSALDALAHEDGTVSLFHDTWPLTGFVKGAFKPWETLLLGPISLDPFVGMDKRYRDTEETGNPFYTSLKPWNRRASDLWHFQRFLRFWGWKL